ncbi:MAG: dTMP kinase [Candidatus Hodarchaeaceae archaeon]|nr:dTMP kinase [Candidatus Hodarchaeaceae archaeon]
MKGKFVSIEGIDGCGKSTHAKLLARWLRARGREVIITDEPTNSTIGRIIKQVLRGELRVPVAVEALLFATDRVQHVKNVIEPAVRSGKVVLNERYIYSSLVYQSARGVPAGWIKLINNYAPKPDLAILIDVPAEVALARIKPSRRLDEFERDLRLQQRVRRNYLRIAKREGLKIVDGARSCGEVQAEIRKLISAVL